VWLEGGIFIVGIIGLGELGELLIRQISPKKQTWGVDIDPRKISSLRKEGFDVGDTIKSDDVYIISVYLTDQVKSVIQQIPLDNNPLIVVESTVLPGTHKWIQDYKRKNEVSFDLVFFPHRYNPDDADHQLFNLHRIMGGESKRAEQRAIEFYSDFMDRKLIHMFPMEVVELSKPLENAYRYYEIAFAEDLRRVCEEKGINYKLLRQAANTKWNIDIKEARTGIGGKCLPKDTALLDNFFDNNLVFRNSIETNMRYENDFVQKSMVRARK